MPEVWRYARRRCSSDHDADDVVAETFAVAWRRRGDVPADGSRLWLLGVARRVLANQRRTTRRVDGLRSRVASLTLSGDLADPAEIVAMRGDERLWHALASLPAGERDLLIMRVWDELPVADVAVLLGCSANAVSLRLRRARRRLAAALRATDRWPDRTSDERSLASERGQP